MSEKIHKSEIVELLKAKTSEMLIPLLEEHKFNHKKSSISYSRKEGDFNQTISISSQSAIIEYQTDIDMYHLVFRISSTIKLPKYTKWVQKRENSGVEFSHRVKNNLCYIPIDNNMITKLSTYTPTTDQSFKTAVSNSIKTASSQEETIIELSSFIESELLEHIAALEKASDIDYLFDNRQDEFSKYYMRLFEYYNRPEKAVQIFTKWFDHWKNLILTSDKINEKNLPVAIENFNKSVLDTNNTFNCNIPHWQK